MSGNGDAAGFFSDVYIFFLYLALAVVSLAGSLTKSR